MWIKNVVGVAWSAMFTQCVSAAPADTPQPAQDQVPIDTAATCDTLVPLYWDRDEDGWGSDEIARYDCYESMGLSDTPGDCDDEDREVYPGVPGCP